MQKNKAFAKKVKIFQGLMQDPLLNIVEQSNLKNFFSAYPFSKVAKNKQSKVFVKNYVENYGAEFASVGQGVYDSFFLLADAIRRSKGKLNPQDLSMAFIGARSKGPRGLNKMQKNHHVSMDVYLVQGNEKKSYEIIKHFKDVMPIPEM